MLGQGAVGMSSGQRQLLAMTRVFLKDADLVVLDEPTADLDPATEEVFSRALKTLLESHTAIVIAHRLSTLKVMDRVVVLESGKVVEEGDRRELECALGSRYSRAVAMQEREEVA